MNSRFLLILAACVCTGAVGFYAGGMSSAPKPTPPPPLPAIPPAEPKDSRTLRIAVVDMQRLFTAHPDTKPSEDAINTKRAAAKTELQRLIDSGDRDAASRFRESREKELQADSAQRRQQIVTDLQQRINVLGTSRNLNLVLDLSGKTRNGVSGVMYASDLPDITDDVIHTLSR